MAYQDFAKDLKSKMLGDSLLFYGAEDYLMSWAVDKVISENVEEDNRDLDVRVIDGENTEAYDILNEAKAYSMFSPKRVVIVKNYLPLYRKTTDAGMEELADYAKETKSSSDSNPSILVFLLESIYSDNLTSYGKQMLKNCTSYDFSRLEKADLNAFISKRIRGASKLIGSRELAHLIDITGYYNRGSGYYLNQLDSDLLKLTGACEGDTIDISLIDEIMMGEGEKYVFDLVEALVSGNRGKALEIAETIIRDEDGSMAVLALLTKQFEIMFDALELSVRGMSISQMAKLTGVNEYRFKKAYTAAMNYRPDKIKALLMSLYDIDRDIKSGDIDRNIALELFVIKAAR